MYMFVLFCWLFLLYHILQRRDPYKVGVKSAPSRKVGQLVRGGPVDIALIGAERVPVDGGRRQDARTDVVRDFGDEGEPTTVVARTHVLAATDTSCLGVDGIDAQGRRSLFLDQYGLVSKGRADKMVSPWTQQRQIVT